MLRKTLAALLAVLLLAVVATASAAAAASKPGGQSRMTICHNPPGNPDGPRTMEIPASAWNGHRNHGDHQGACTTDDRPRPAQPDQPQPRAPTTPLSLSASGKGDVDGDALFRVTVRNGGGDAAHGVSVDGTLVGEGHWSVEGQGDLCSVDSRQHLACSFGDLPAQSERAFRLRFDGPVTLCREATATLLLQAQNDASAGDDRVRESAKTGACAIGGGVASPAPALAIGA